jgi:hypothetical protein
MSTFKRLIFIAPVTVASAIVSAYDQPGGCFAGRENLGPGAPLATRTIDFGLHLRG